MSDALAPTLPRTGRLALPSWWQPRIAVGLALVAGSVVLGARVLGSADRYTQVLVASHPLVPGERLTGADVTVGRVRFAAGGSSYIAGTSAPDGYVVTRYVGAGELVPTGALSDTASMVAATRAVAVPVAVGHLPLDLARGDQVDVYVTSKSTGASGSPTLVLAAAAVDQVSGGDAVGADDDESVLLDVPQAAVLGLIRAGESGVVDVVRVPPPDQVIS